ncbi:MAG: hypothetical protein KBT36_17270 [Kurthia sp.]|nr:hypothetical protein [Candidatus Kurthia equi]
MKTIEEKAKEAAALCTACSISQDTGCSECENRGFYYGYIDGAAEQGKIDHSKEHVLWLIKQYHDWEYEKGHDMDTESWEEWISKALKEL